jgi:hypothetical protein
MRLYRSTVRQTQAPAGFRSADVSEADKKGNQTLIAKTSKEQSSSQVVRPGNASFVAKWFRGEDQV